MPTSPALPPTEVEVARIRELSKDGRHYEALAAAEELAVTAPESRDALYLIAANQRCLNRVIDALATLQRLEQLHPRFSLLYQERGSCYTTLRDVPRAIDAFSRALNLNPALATSWTMLERLYRATGDMKNAATAAAQIATLNGLPPEIVRTACLFSDGDLSSAEHHLRTYLRKAGDHVEALRLLARIEHQGNLLYDADLLLEAALKLAPNYTAACVDHVRVLLDRQKYLQALEEISRLQEIEPDNRDHLTLYAAADYGWSGYRCVRYRGFLAIP